MPGVKVIFYDKADGTKPAEEFIVGLDEGMQAKILRAIDMLKVLGRSSEDRFLLLWAMGFLS